MSAYFSSFLAFILLIFTYPVLGIPLKAVGKPTNLPLSGNTFYKKTNPTSATPSLSSNNSLMYENTAQSDMFSQEFEPQIFILSENIPYEYAYENEIKDGKFLHGEVFEVSGQSKDWIILVNFHGSTPLNTKSTFVPGTRTLSWASPFEYARYLFSNLSDAHNYSALLLDWQIRPQSEGQAANRHVYRDQITFLFIPPKTNITFLIGFASAQDARDQRAGGGIQMRLKFLPQGTITVQTRLKFIKNSSLDSSKEYKNYDFERTYEDAVYTLQNYLTQESALANVQGIQLPPHIMHPPFNIYSTLVPSDTLQELKEHVDQLTIKEWVKHFDIRAYIDNKFSIFTKLPR